MKSSFRTVALAFTLGGCLAAAPAAYAQMGPQQPWTNTDPTIRTTYVRIASGVPGVLYEPVNPGPKSAVAVFVMHASGDYTNHSSCTELSRRGYRVLCANNDTSKTGMFDDGALDKVMLEVKAAVGWLRTVPGVRKVVLFGHSGGATVMTAYQMIAEGGAAACQRAELVWKCGDNLAGLGAADGMVLADANWGQSTMSLFSIDPSVVAENALRSNPALDMFNPQNGFKPSGSTYTQDFITRFQTAEGRRNNAILANAQARFAAIQAGKGQFSDDEPFFVAGATFIGGNNKLYSQDVRLISRSLKPWPLVHADGSVTTQIIHSVRPAMNTENLSRSMMRGALKTTVRGFLSSYAMRVGPDFSYGETSEIHGVDWRSNYANPVGNVEGIAMPLLTLGMTGGWEGLAAETIFNHARSADKSLAFIEGATHVYTTCKRCETTPGQYGDTVKTTYDYIDGWLSKAGRFLN